MQAVLRRRSDRFSPLWLFVALAVVAYVVESLIVRSSRFAQRPDAIALAVTIDLALVVPGLYWLLMVRSRRAPLISLAGVFLVSLAGAAAILPEGHHQFLRMAELLAFPVEIGVIWLVVRSVRAAAARARSSAEPMDIPERVEAALEEMVGNRRLAAVLAMELSILYYALASWRRRPFAPAGTLGYWYHVQSSLAAVLGALALASAAELLAVHFLLRAASPRAAWGLTTLSIVGVLWLVGFLRSAVLRPVLLSRDHLRVRTGLQWRLDVPLAEIEHVTVGRVTAPRKGEPGALRAVRFGQPNVELGLRTPHVARGMYGVERTVTRVVLTLDDRKGFERALRERLGTGAFAG